MAGKICSTKIAWRICSKRNAKFHPAKPSSRRCWSKSLTVFTLTPFARCATRRRNRKSNIPAKPAMKLRQWREFERTSESDTAKWRFKSLSAAFTGWTLKPFYGLIPTVMNSSLVKAAPQGDFAEISVLFAGWETRFQTLVSQRRPIKFDIYPNPDLLSKINNRLDQQGYTDLVLEKDRWLHFLVPDPN